MVVYVYIIYNIYIYLSSYPHRRPVHPRSPGQVLQLPGHQQQAAQAARVPGEMILSDTDSAEEMWGLWCVNVGSCAIVITSSMEV